MSLRVLFCVALVATCACLTTTSATSGTIEDVKHIVIWMQENRAYDHYYGTLRGVRGFNDRAAPPLPNGRPVWYQPVGKQPHHTPLCGCTTCDISWTPVGAQLKDMIMGLDCPTLATDLAGAVPPITISKGMKCETLLSDMLHSSYDHLKFNEFIYPNSSCPAAAVVTGNPDPTVEAATNANSSYILPFNLQFDKTSAQCMAAPEMAYESDINIFNGGLVDAWNVARAPGFGMAYFNRTDLPYYYALADAFTVGDQYFQSTFTATNPNRLHLFSGSNGLSVPNSGYCQLDDSEPLPGFTWETMGQTLMKANKTWRVLQMADNFDDNAFAWFKDFRESSPGDPLYDNGLADVPDLVKAFSDMVANDSLPDVMWLVGPTAKSEHATNHPGDGEDYSHQLIEVLRKPENAAVYAKTAFILNYDEGGQFFDHAVPPTPPTNASDGKSTVTTVGELTLKEEFGIAAGNPIGMGYRVPLFLISPWSRGDYTFSQVCDHTSVIQFIEKRFGVQCPNISPWRRAVSCDLTAGFDFANPDYSWPANMPSTADNVNMSKLECETLPAPTLPTAQRLGYQEPGVRKARALPYEFDISDTIAPNGSVVLTMKNTGGAGAVFYVYNFMSAWSHPRKYTVEAGKMLDDAWPPVANKYNLSLHGPNGFVRKFAGSVPTSPALSAHITYLPKDDAVTVSVAAPTTDAACTFTITDNAYGLGGPWTVTASEAAAAGAPMTRTFATGASGNWYDFTVTASPACGATFSRTFMGHMENGKDSITDPAMSHHPAGPVRRLQELQHPPIPDDYRVPRKWAPSQDCSNRRSRHKDACWGLGAEVGVHGDVAKLD